MAIDAKQAVQVAMEYVREMYSNEQISDLLLEEIETSKSGNDWLVTISFYRPTKGYPAGSIGEMIGGSTSAARRQYKVLIVDKVQGTIHGMKIRARATSD